MLTRTEELETARRFVAGDKAAGDQLVVANLRYAVKQAHRYARFGHPLDDLVQAANEGLLRACDTFDPERGFRFLTYATHWVDARLRDYCYRNHSLVRYGTTQVQREMLFRGYALYRKYESLGLPEDEIFSRIAEDVEADVAKVAEAFSRVTGRDSYADEWRSEQARQDDDLVEAERQAQVRAILMRHARRPREVAVIEWRILADDPPTYTEIGVRLWCSREAVRQIEETIKKRATRELEALCL